MQVDVLPRRPGLPEPTLPSDESSRVRLAARADTPATTLRRLADDPSVTVRAAVAMNPVYAPAATCRLTNDPDERVRCLLADKVARLLPDLSANEQTAAQAHIHRTLLVLAGDAAIRVRVAMSEILTGMPQAPRTVILKLAQDPIAAVSEPVLRLSPLLTDQDLMDLLATPAHPGTAKAVASRAGLTENVADRIAEQADSAAIRSLLQNHSAAIRESTLDALIGRAGDHPEWHEPLARRPSLPDRAARALSRIVTGQVIDVLIQRGDLSPPLAAELRSRMAATLTEPSIASEASVLEGVRQLNAAGQLSEGALMDAIAAGDNRQVAAIFAVASGITLAALDRAVALRSAKALISLAWKANFSMRAALAVQATLGQLSPGEVMGPAQQGTFPLTEDEMAWQIELLDDPAQPARLPK